jgi:7-carboxy-7-deazaguanine synthase
VRVVEIFDSLQGEGYWTGIPTSFVRLAGCNAPDLGLACVRWCDTPESWDPLVGIEMTAREVLDRIRLPRLCITGGEPLIDAQAVATLIDEAHFRGVRVHVETNGTIDPLLPAGPAGAEAGEVLPFDWAVVSPKPPDYRVAPAWDEHIDELKLVVDDVLDVSIAERLAARYPGAFVSIQPEFGGRPDASEREWDRSASASVRRAIALVITHPDWRLSLQTHKLLGIR